MRHPTIPLLTVLLVAALVGDLARAQDLDAAFDALVQYEIGDESAPLERIRDAVSASKSDLGRRSELEGWLLRLIASDGVSEFAKQFASKELYRIAGPASIERLKPLLIDKELSYLARYVVERMPGPAAQSALVSALKKTSGETRVGIINSLGERRDETAGEALRKLARKGDVETLHAALAALGKIGGFDAANHLLWASRNVPRKSRPLAAEAYLRAADGFYDRGEVDVAAGMYRRFSHEAEADYIRMAAFRGLVEADVANAAMNILEALNSDDAVLQSVAAETAPDISSPAGLRTLADNLHSLPPRFQVRILNVLAAHGDPIALDATLNATEHKDPVVRAAAAAALEAYPSIATIDSLLAIAAEEEGEVREAARKALGYIDLPQAEDRFINAAMHSNNILRFEAIHAMAQRRSDKAIAVLLRIARRDTETLRIEALHSLGQLAKVDTLPAVVDLLLTATTAETFKAAQASLVTAMKRMPSGKDRVEALRKGYKEAAKDGKSDLAIIEVLGEIADDSGLKTLELAAARGGTQAQAAAVKALAQWPNPLPLDGLLKVAMRVEDEALQSNAYEGVLRLVQLPSKRSPKDTLKIYEKTMPLATTKVRKLLLISALGQSGEPALGEIVTLYLEDPDVGEEAALAKQQLEDSVEKRGS